MMFLINIINVASNVHKTIDIEISTKQCTDISNIGNFKSNILDLIFKLSFFKINSNFNCQFIIIDEIFDACSNQNKAFAMKLVEYFKTQYDKMLFVSHNEAIINLFDEELKIVSTDNGNMII